MLIPKYLLFICLNWNTRILHHILFLFITETDSLYAINSFVPHKIKLYRVCLQSIQSFQPFSRSWSIKINFNQFKFHLNIALIKRLLCYQSNMLVYHKNSNTQYWSLHITWICVGRNLYPYYYASPLCDMREVYCFPHHQLIFRFGRRVIYHSKGLSEYIHSEILKSIIFVCLYHVLKTNTWPLFLSLIFDVIYQWICLDKLYKQMESFF